MRSIAKKLSLEDVNPNTTFYSYYFFPRAPRRESRCFFYALTLIRKGKLNPISLFVAKSVISIVF